MYGREMEVPYIYYNTILPRIRKTKIKPKKKRLAYIIPLLCVLKCVCFCIWGERGLTHTHTHARTHARKQKYFHHITGLMKEGKNVRHSGENGMYFVTHAVLSRCHVGAIFVAPGVLVE